MRPQRSARSTKTTPAGCSQAYVRGVSMALLVSFFALLTTWFRTGNEAAARLWYGAAVSVAAVELVRVAVVAGVAVQPERIPEGTVVALHAVGVILGAVIAFPLAAGQVAGCLLIANSRLPGWLVPTGALLSILWLITGVRAVSEAHVLWTAGTVVTLMWGLWLVAICVALARREVAA